MSLVAGSQHTIHFPQSLPQPKPDRFRPLFAHKPQGPPIAALQPDPSYEASPFSTHPPSTRQAERRINFRQAPWLSHHTYTPTTRYFTQSSRVRKSNQRCRPASVSHGRISTLSAAALTGRKAMVAISFIILPDNNARRYHRVEKRMRISCCLPLIYRAG